MRILSKIHYLFPVKHISALSKDNKRTTIILFLLAIVFSVIKGYAQNENIDPYPFIGFFDGLTGLPKDLFTIVIKMLYSPPGMAFLLVLAFSIFLWLVFKISGSDTRYSFKEFVLPFLGLIYFGYCVLLISALLKMLSFEVPKPADYIVFIYWMIFYWKILTALFQVKILRAAISVSVAFLCVFIFGGFPTVVPYLAWVW
jgi:hypothetical protein